MPVVVFFEKETETRAKITMIHNQPYDEKNGLPLERIKQGIEVESVPKRENIEGKKAVAYINPQTKEIWYEYEDIPLTKEEQRIKELEDRIAKLEKQ